MPPSHLLRDPESDPQLGVNIVYELLSLLRPRHPTIDP